MCLSPSYILRNADVHRGSSQDVCHGCQFAKLPILTRLQAQMALKQQCLARDKAQKVDQALHAEQELEYQKRLQSMLGPRPNSGYIVG